MPGALSRVRPGLGLVALGMIVQLGCALLWSPGAFIVSAAVGFPLVLVGAIVTGSTFRQLSREREQRESP